MVPGNRTDRNMDRGQRRNDSPIPLLLSLAVLLWTAGFDILYACQDHEFDISSGLHSIPQRFGIANALLVARLLHTAMFAALVLIYFLTSLHWLGLAGIAAVAALLIYQHRLVRANDLSRLNVAFFDQRLRKCYSLCSGGCRSPADQVKTDGT
jgi:4-hydroxybenzoate polyprenyltransferase